MATKNAEGEPLILSTNQMKFVTPSCCFKFDWDIQLGSECNLLVSSLPKNDPGQQHRCNSCFEKKARGKKFQKYDQGRFTYVPPDQLNQTPQQMIKDNIEDTLWYTVPQYCTKFGYDYNDIKNLAAWIYLSHIAIMMHFLYNKNDSSDDSYCAPRGTVQKLVDSQYQIYKIKVLYDLAMDTNDDDWTTKVEKVLMYGRDPLLLFEVRNFKRHIQSMNEVELQNENDECNSLRNITFSQCRKHIDNYRKNTRRLARINAANPPDNKEKTDEEKALHRERKANEKVHDYRRRELSLKLILNNTQILCESAYRCASIVDTTNIDHMKKFGRDCHLCVKRRYRSGWMEGNKRRQEKLIQEQECVEIFKNSLVCSFIESPDDIVTSAPNQCTVHHVHREKFHSDVNFNTTDDMCREYCGCSVACKLPNNQHGTMASLSNYIITLIDDMNKTGQTALDKYIADKQQHFEGTLNSRQAIISNMAVATSSYVHHWHHVEEDLKTGDMSTLNDKQRMKEMLRCIRQHSMCHQWFYTNVEHRVLQENSPTRTVTKYREIKARMFEENNMTCEMLKEFGMPCLMGYDTRDKAEKEIEIIKQFLREKKIVLTVPVLHYFLTAFHVHHLDPLLKFGYKFHALPFDQVEDTMISNGQVGCPCCHGFLSIIYNHFGMSNRKNYDPRFG